MFKRLGTTLKQRAAAYQAMESRNRQTGDAAAVFLQEKYGPLAQTLSYAWKDDVLMIQTASKTLATELTLSLPEFSAFLKQHGVQVSRIIIH